MSNYEDPRFDKERIAPSDNVVDLLRNSLDSMLELPEPTRHIEPFSEAFSNATQSGSHEDTEALFGIDRLSIQSWLTRNDGIVDEYGDTPEEPPATIWPIKIVGHKGKKLGSENYYGSRNDVINRDAETLSGAIGKLGSDYYVDAFRQALESYQNGNRARGVERTSLTWLWYDMTDEYKPDTELDFHTLLANELKMRFTENDNDVLAELTNADLIKGLFTIQSGDQGLFPGEVENLRSVYWSAANSLIRIFDSDPYTLSIEDYHSCLELCEAFAAMQNKHPTEHGREFNSAFARDIGVDSRAADVVLVVGSNSPDQIIRPDKLVGNDLFFEWALLKSSDEVSDISLSQSTVLGVLAYVSALQNINRAISERGSSMDKAKADLLEFIMHEDFMPEANGNIAVKEKLLRSALGDEAILI